MEAEALKFVRDHKDRPFFLYLPFGIPHVAIQVPDDSLAEYKGKWDDPAYTGGKGYLPHPAPRAGYAAMVTRMDRSVGRLTALLKELDLDGNTVVFFSSDNGPTHNVGGAYSDFFESAGGLRGLKGGVFEGGLATRMIVRWPGKVKPGSVSDWTGAFCDVLPTLCDIAGAEVPAADTDGISFLPTLLGKADQNRHEFLYWEFPGYGGQQAVRMGDWKGVRTGMGKGNTRIALYDLAKDPAESDDVAARHPDVVARIAKIMAEQHVPSKAFPIKVLDGGM
jgi:arylsulfatase